MGKEAGGVVGEHTESQQRSAYLALRPVSVVRVDKVPEVSRVRLAAVETRMAAHLVEEEADRARPRRRVTEVDER